MQLEKFALSLSLAITSGAIAHATHQPIPTVINNGGDVTVKYDQPYAGIGKLSAIAFVMGSGYFFSAGLKTGSKEQLTTVIEAPTVQESVIVQSAAPIPKRIASVPQWTKDPVEEEPKEQTTEPKAVVRPQTVEPKPLELLDRIFNFNKRMLLIPASIGSGKTTLLLLMMQHFHDQTQGNVEFYGSSAKASPWLGLENEIAEDGLLRILDIDPTQPETILPLIRRFKWLQSKLVARQNLRKRLEAENKPYNPKRLIIVCEEWNSTLAIAQTYDRQEKEQGKKSDKFGEIVELQNYFINVGREDEFGFWIFAQDHQVQNVHVNTGYKKNLGNLVPFRCGAMEAIEDALIGQRPLVPMRKGQEILEQCEKIASQNPDNYYVYSGLYGHEIFAVPYAPDIKKSKLGRSNVVELKPKLQRDLEELEQDIWEA